jgi:hypothetical protein
MSDKGGMSLTIDHVTIAGRELDAMRQTYAAIGLATDYGGPHTSGTTHMALLGFDDGSYVELISSREPGQPGSKWDAHIAGNGGPAGWALATNDIAGEAARISELGVPIHGPTAMTRRRPDGVLLEWEILDVGDQGGGAVLPFLIQDHTPREWRVQPSASVAGGELRGVAQAVLGVARLEQAASLFRRVYGWGEPEIREDGEFDARLAWFAGTPVLLAAPLASGEGWLAERLTRFGESPCAFVLASADLAASAQRLPLGVAQEWPGGQVAWIPRERLNGARLGVMAAAEERRTSLAEG